MAKITLVFLFYSLICCWKSNSNGLDGYSYFDKGIQKRLSECLKLPLPIVSGLTASQLKRHYIEILNITAKYRQAPPQANGNDNQESYIEKLFIDTFAHKNWDYFSNLVPLFIQWTDYQQIHKSSSLKHDEHVMFRDILPYLRRDVVYVTMAQANKGLSLFREWKNVLVISAGGVGHVPIPLVNGVIERSPFNLSQLGRYDQVSFYGSLSHGPRQALVTELQRELKVSKGPVNKMSVGKSTEWKLLMSNTVFNLAPVGFGRGTFRLSEIIRMGRIPVLLYSDYPWLPYEGTSVSPAELGLVAKQGEMKQLVRKMNKIYSNATLLAEYLTKVDSAREVYTNEGILRQIELFFQDPLGPAGGRLRCSTVYRQYKETREGSIFFRIIDYVQSVS